MRMRLLCLAVAFGPLGSLPVAAGAPDVSPHPPARHMIAAEPGSIDRLATAIRQVRPEVRPPSPQDIVTAERSESMAFVSLDRSVRPALRPQSVVILAMGKKRKQMEGAVCGTPELQGDVVGFVPGKIKACGIKDAVRVRSVAGVKLSQKALMNCPTALALKKWVETGVKPAFRKRGPVVEMNVAAHYACRTRNNQPGARISEHGKGNAIDISAFTMKDGEVITVLKGWGQGTTNRLLRRVHKTACGPFGTVLGPQSDRHHRDHFHLDTARYRTGPYCR